MSLPASEQVVRAVCSDMYQEDTREFSDQIWEGKNVSCSRLEIVQLPNQWVLLASTVQKVPKRVLTGLSELNVGAAVERARECVTNDRPNGYEIAVEADSRAENRAHAEVRPKITPPVARALFKIQQLHNLPRGFDPRTVARVIP